MRVLVLDDDSVLGTMVVRMLETQGHQVVLVDSPSDAVLKLEADTFDIVVSDFNAGPGLRGTEVLRMARARLPKARLVLMSGNTPEEIGDMGGAAFLPKPFGMDDLLAKISA